MNEIKTHDTMSSEAQRIKIAEACGWKFIADYCHGEDQPPDYTTVTPDGRHLCGHYPDYFNDLNACHEFEKSLPNSLTQKYWWSLCDVTGLDQYEACRDPLLTVSATAAQRCEAFLRTIGKWVTA